MLCSGIFFLTAGSAVLNQYTERDLDAKMARTSRRPIVKNVISGKTALAVLILLITSGSLLLLATGTVPFILGLSGIFLYNFLYTSLKKLTFLAIIPGALVGSIPPLIGFTSAGGNILEERILFFSAFMFLWQVPHFLLLLIRYGSEYQDAGFRTLYDFAGVSQIRKITLIWIVISSLLLGVYLFALSTFSLLFASLFSSVTGIYILLLFLGLADVKSSWDNKRVFMLFNIYSFLIMILLAVTSITNTL
jgi:protoheme IX farnesyltransferase